MNKVDKEVLHRLKKRYPEVTDVIHKVTGGGGGHYNISLKLCITMLRYSPKNFKTNINKHRT